jgi:ABC-2 type transport system ATP-binding protein
MVPVLAVTALRKAFGDKLAVNGISFAVGHNEIVGLLGPNGAGKTTTINMILGVLEPTAGAIRIEGRDVATQRAQALACTNFTAVYAPLPGNLTVYQNLRFFSLIYNVRGAAARIEELLEQFELTTFRDVKCGLLSSGEQTRAALAKAMLNRPHLLLLDEPTASLDPDTGDWVRAYLERYVAEKKSTILLASHNMSEVERMASLVLMMKAGRLVDRGTAKELLQKYGRRNLEEVFLDIARDRRRVEAEPVA